VGGTPAGTRSQQNCSRAGLLAGRAAKTGRSLARRLFWGEHGGAANTVSVSLNQKETQALLQQVPKAYNTQINDVLLTALQAFAEWTGETLLVDQEGHGREDDVDLSRTTGLPQLRQRPTA